MSDTTATPKKVKRDRGTGCLIPPRVGISAFWTAQVQDANGRAVRRTTKVRGELKPGCDPKLPESWTNITAAKAFLKELVKNTDSGAVKVGSDPTQMRYGALRALYMNDYREQERKSLMKNSESEADYVCGLNWLDEFFDYDESAEGKATDKGARIASITPERIAEFKAQRTAAGAANGTVNRSLAALRRMFKLAQQAGKLQTAPFIKLLPEPKQPRTGFIGMAEYQRLYDALGVEIKNVSLGTTSKPYAYVQPLLQVGYYTGMRLSEILNLRWSSVDLKDKMIRLSAAETKTDSARNIPMIDGLPALFESLRRTSWGKTAGPNDRVFTNNGAPIASFIKAWRKACVKAAIPVIKNGVSIVSHFDGAKYEGLVFHALRRSAIRNMIRAGVDRVVAKRISGHATDEVFERYNIVDDADLQDAATKTGASLRNQKDALPASKLALVK